MTADGPDTATVVEVVQTLDAEHPPVLEVAEALADARELPIATAQTAVYDAIDAGVLEEAGEGVRGLRVAEDPREQPAAPDCGDETPTPDTSETTTRDGDVSEYRRIYLDAAERAGRETWEFVEEEALRAALVDAGFPQLLERGDLFGISGWRVVDTSDDGEEPARRWYYPSEHEPRPDEFRRFHELLTQQTPDGYEPFYFRVRKAGKAPATQYGSWKDDDARLSVAEAVDWMNEGGNVGVAGTPDDALVNVDIDDDEATTPDDVPVSLRARSRSRTGWHTWYFDPAGDIPNIPSDEYGEIRTDWQYVVAPGSFVASTREEIPDDATDPGYYTVEDDAPVAAIEYDELPEVFRDVAESTEPADEEEDDNALDDSDSDPRESTGEESAVFDVEATDLVTNKNTSDRFTSIFHDSSTGSNMSVSDEGKLHCWRHGVAHGGLQALAVLSDKTRHGCKELGAAHKRSGAGRNRLKGDWRLVWAAWHEAKDRGHIPDDDPIPYVALRGLAVEEGVVDRDELVVREADTGDVVENPETHDGSTYKSFPPGAYADALEHVRDEHGVDPGREVPEPSDTAGDPDTEGDHRVDPVDAEAVFEPRHAWEAAQRVEADDLDEPLPEFADAPDIVRAVALAEDHADDLTEASTLDAAAYFDLYNRARTEYGAPLPVYVDATRTVDDLEATRAAVENLKAWHILEEVESEITVEDPAGDAIAKLNPTWEDSDSGERIVAFASGLFWCAAHDQVIDPLRLVALEAGVIDDETARLDGGDYLDVYELARTEYDAPLPAVSWLDSELTPDPEHAAVLPPAEELVGEFTTDRDGLGAARDGVEDLYLDLARDTDADAVLSAEPNTGKSTAAVKSASKEPTLLLAPRRTLQKEYVETANDPDVVGDSPPETYTLPVFAEPWEGVSREAAEQGVAAVREDPDGFDLLKDGAALREAVEERLGPDEPLEATDPGADTVVLDRATDDTAAGEYGPEWALRASTAHALGLRPQTIHQRDEELFGEPLPCNHDHDHGDGDRGEHEEERAACSYTEAYEYVTDPERPIDLLIGSRVHAKVESAKTYHYTEDDQPRKQPRAVAIDEDVVGDYTTEWDDDARHVATWLAAALTDTVEDGHDLARQADRLRDGWVFDWLREQGDEHLPDLERRATIADALVTVARASDRSPAAERAREVVLRESTVDTETAVAVLEELLDTPRRDLGEYTIQALRRLDEDGALQDALDDVHTDGPLGAFTTPDLDPGEAFVEAAQRPFNLLADAPQDDPEDYLEHLDAATATLRDLVAGGADGTRELVVRARDGYAHPDAYLLLGGAIGGDKDPLRAHSGGVAGRDEPTRANRVCLGDAKIVYDRNGDGAVVIDPPAFTGGGGDCSVVGLDATPRPSLWEQFAGLDAEVVSPFDGLEERREFVEETRNLQVVQTEHRAVNTYSGDPTGKSFDKDRELVEKVSEKFGGHQLRRDSLTTTGSPAVVSTKTLVGEGGYLRDELEDDAADFAHYWDIAGRNDLGKHKLAVLLGAPHPGDQAIEQAALLAGEEIDPEGHGTEKDYNSEVANAMLAHAWQDQVTQAVHRFGRDKDGAVVFVHSAAVDEERLPVVANGGVTTAWSDAGKAVRDEILPYLRAGAEFTVDDVVEAVEYGRRAVQQKLAEFERLGYVDRLVGGPGRANVFNAVADPGENGHVELEGVDASPGVTGEENERARNGTQYTSPFGLAEDSPGSDPPIPPERPTLPPPTAAEPVISRGDPPR